MFPKPEVSIQLWQCKGLYPMLSSSDLIMLELRTTHPVDEVDESLSLFAPKVPCSSDPG